MHNVLALIAIFLWASLAMASNLLKGIPPFMQLSFAFGIGAIPALLFPKKSFPPLKTLLVSVMGFYGYHFFLFTAFRLAPPVESNLINYLWPMLMVLMAPLFFKEAKLHWTHFLGAFFAFVGVIILMRARSEGFEINSLIGYLCALAAAVTWPLYSLTKKKLPETNALMTSGVCLVAAILCFVTHLLTENTVTPQSTQWALLVWLGVGPFGAAFFLWDKALKRGDPRMIGAISYLTPVISTVLLVFVAHQNATSATWIAMGLMTLGSVVGALGSR
ncbi:MAG: EamA family transporter [Bacteriovoracaceae bacterium]|nr:EamA family transporter [Bacteriovoracaceae bacterium]